MGSSWDGAPGRATAKVEHRICLPAHPPPTHAPEVTGSLHIRGAQRPGGMKYLMGLGLMFWKVPPVPWVRDSRQGGAGGRASRKGEAACARGPGVRPGLACCVGGTARSLCVWSRAGGGRGQVRPVEQDPLGAEGRGSDFSLRAVGSYWKVLCQGEIGAHLPA